MLESWWLSATGLLHAWRSVIVDIDYVQFHLGEGGGSHVPRPNILGRCIDDELTQPSERQVCAC